MHGRRPFKHAIIEQMAVAALAGVVAFGTVRPLRAADCTIYVRAGSISPSGVVDGRTPMTAYDSIEVGALSVSNPGDIVCVGPGEYREGNIAPPLSGIPAFPIVFHGDGSGALTGDPPGSAC